MNSTNQTQINDAFRAMRERNSALRTNIDLSEARENEKIARYGLYMTFSYTLMYIGSLVGSVLGLVYGINMLVDKKDTHNGTVLIVLSCTGVLAAAGALSGFVIGIIICLPFWVMTKNKNSEEIV